MSKQRVEGLSDAILAIIVTIMALELELPHQLSLEGFKTILPMVFIYIASFLQIMTVWLYYHELFRLVDQITFRIFGANSVWLLTASFVPLATRAIGHYSDRFASLIFYLSVLVIWDLAWMLLTKVVLTSSTKEIPLTARKIPYRWGISYFSQMVVILALTFLWPNVIPFAPLLMIVNVSYGFLSNRCIVYTQSKPKIDDIIES